MVDLKFRCIEDHDCKEHGHVKYLGLSNHPAHLFNVQALHEAKTVLYITEGELDAISATVAGCPAVGISGAQKWKPHYTYILDDFEEVVILADGDEPGREFAKRVRQEVERSHIVYFPDGQDPNAYFRSKGTEAFRRYVGAAE